MYMCSHTSGEYYLVVCIATVAIVTGYNKNIIICDWIYKNRSKSHNWEFQKYQIEVLNPLWLSSAKVQPR